MTILAVLFPSGGDQPIGEIPQPGERVRMLRVWIRSRLAESIEVLRGDPRKRLVNNEAYRRRYALLAWIWT